MLMRSDHLDLITNEGDLLCFTSASLTFFPSISAEIITSALKFLQFCLGTLSWRRCGSNRPTDHTSDITVTITKLLNA